MISSFEESGDRISAFFEPSHEERFFVLKGKEKLEVTPKDMKGYHILDNPDLTAKAICRLAEAHVPKGEDATHFCSSRVSQNGNFCYYLIRYYQL